MKINDIRNYVLEPNFKITYIENKLDIINYNKIEHLDNNKIIVSYEKGIMVIDGKELVLKKMLKDEILITGMISKIELR